MNGIVTCASPECWEDPSQGSRFCSDHLGLFARLRDEVEEECKQGNTWKKGVIRCAAVGAQRKRDAQRRAQELEALAGLEEELDTELLVAA